ncbi:MAG: glycosyltransferase family 39 protein [Chloroflexi bacterium]|nr:glycosyltransferase family 39 protein [Chloroflexota bacterium]MBP8059395.1 glycosyltransferase family 39 protein [Chloroflexota bacterium]
MATKVATTDKPRGQISVKQMGWGILAAALLFFAFFNLRNYPATWFDEGSHLHVPKTLLQHGVYADISSEGLRYFGPTLGVGPTVLLPIALMFKIAGIGLVQARIVMGLYLLATVFAFYKLANTLGGRTLALFAAALFVTSRTIGTLEYGRQVLGEIPGFLFIALAFWLWFSAWDNASYGRLAGVGLLFGLATITKQQYLLVLAPTLGLAWISNWFYYRQKGHLHFLIPGILTAASYAVWQVILIVFLAPGTASENLRLLGAAAGGAAFVFDPGIMAEAFRQLTSFNLFLGFLLPVLVYSFFLVLPRNKQGQQWGILYILVIANLGWYVVSIGWIRYAFAGLAISSLFVSRFFLDVTENFRLGEYGQKLWAMVQGKEEGNLPQLALRVTLALWLVGMIVLPLAQNLKNIALTQENAAADMAAYLSENVPLTAIIETWEPEIGFLADQKFHYPPSGTLNLSVQQKFMNGPLVAEQYNFQEHVDAEYVLIGNFATWIELYTPAQLEPTYQQEAQFGPYILYKRQ